MQIEMRAPDGRLHHAENEFEALYLVVAAGYRRTGATLPVIPTVAQRLDAIEAAIAALPTAGSASPAILAEDRGAPGGVAPLDGNARVPTANVYAASPTQRGVVQLTGDLGGTSTTPLVPALAGRAVTTRVIGAGFGLHGGGDLSVDRVIEVNVGTLPGTVAAGEHDHLVAATPLEQPFAASLTPNAAAGNYRYVLAPDDFTLNEPSLARDGQLWRLRIVSTDGPVTVSLAAELHRPAHLPAALEVPAGRRGDIGLLYETGDGWTVLGAQAA